jgi:hypothetical protein
MEKALRFQAKVDVYLGLTIIIFKSHRKGAGGTGIVLVCGRCLYVLCVQLNRQLEDRHHDRGCTQPNGGQGVHVGSSEHLCVNYIRSQGLQGKAGLLLSCF